MGGVKVFNFLGFHATASMASGYRLISTFPFPSSGLNRRRIRTYFYFVNIFILIIELLLQDNWGRG